MTARIITTMAIVQDSYRVVTIINAAKEFKILAQNTLDGPIMASPIADGSALFIRTDKALYKIGK